MIVQLKNSQTFISQLNGGTRFQVCLKKNLKAKSKKKILNVHRTILAISDFDALTNCLQIVHKLNTVYIVNTV